MLWTMAMSSGCCLVNAETQRLAEKRREQQLSANLCESLRLCVKPALAVAAAVSRCVLLVTLLIVTLGWAASAQISTAPATNAAVKIAAPGFVGSRSCRERHQNGHE